VAVLKRKPREASGAKEGTDCGLELEARSPQCVHLATIKVRRKVRAIVSICVQPHGAGGPNQFQSMLRLAKRNMTAKMKPIGIMMPQMAPTTKAVINQAVDTSHIVRPNDFRTFAASRSLAL
jgi:hypothetical protein